MRASELLAVLRAVVAEHGPDTLVRVADGSALLVFSAHIETEHGSTEPEEPADGVKVLYLDVTG